MIRLSCVCLALLAVTVDAYADEVRPVEGPAIGPVHREYRHRPGPRFMVPLKIDLGAAFANTGRGFASGVGGAIGIHWASLSPNPTDTDVGIGVFGALLSAPVDPSGTNTMNGIAYGGAYLEGAHTLSHGNWWRTWGSLRGEYVSSGVFGVDRKGYGVSGRLSAELYASGVGIEPRGVFLGTYAIGVYAEAGLREMAAGMSDFQITTGLTFRTPFVFAPF